jgi:WXG100 family type VII secretion target
MSLYEVNWDEVNAASAAVNSATSALDATLGDVNAEGNQLSANWASETQLVYHERQTAWNQAGRNIDAALAMFVKSLTHAATIASSTEHTNRGVVAG